MSKFRRIAVFLCSLVFVFGAYVIYNRFVETPRIKPFEEESGVEMETPEFSERPSEIGDTVVGSVEQSRFIFLDPDTKELKQVFGFEKLLGREEGSVRRKVVDPYMEVYEKNFRCRITSDYGMVRVETAAGAQSPKDARLYGDVRIHVQSGGKERPTESTIYLEDVSYNSERSEFVTDKPIRLVSEDVEMVGTGMVLIYNTRWGRLEYFKVIDLEELCFKNVRNFMPSDSGVDEREEESELVEERPVLESGVGEAVRSGREDEYYECRFSKDVVIEYGQEVIVTSAEDVTITNIIWSGGAVEDEGGLEGAEVSEPKEDLGQSAGEGKVAEGIESDSEIITVTVKCRGGMVVEPIVSVMGPVSMGGVEAGWSGEFSDVPVFIERTASEELILKDLNFAGGAVEKIEGDESKNVGDSEKLREPVKFKASKIDYDVGTGNAIARGPVEFTFYAEMDSNEIGTAAGVCPVVITAQRNAEFLVDESGRIDRVIFNDDVVGVRSVKTAAYDQEDRFTGKRMVVELDGGEETDAMEIRHVVIEGGGVKLESLRSKEEETISHVRLICKRIDYYLKGSAIIATGPGKIELDNSKVEPAARSEGTEDKSKHFDMDGPCYAYAEGFKNLRWFMEEDVIITDGGGHSVSLSYVPVVEGKLGAVVRASSGYMEAGFVKTGSGRSQLERLRAKEGVYYDEEDGHWFEGESLSYEAGEGLMSITGTEAKPCIANGTQVPEIEYNLKTGKVKTRLSSRPGTVVQPQKVGN